MALRGISDYTAADSVRHDRPRRPRRAVPGLHPDFRRGEACTPRSRHRSGLQACRCVQSTVMLHRRQPPLWPSRSHGALGVDEVHSGAAARRQGGAGRKAAFRQKAEKDKLAFVGDGINDAPVLMPRRYRHRDGRDWFSDAAIEAADVVLMDDDPAEDQPRPSASPASASRIVYQNIVFALAVKALCLDSRPRWASRTCGGASLRMSAS